MRKRLGLSSIAVLNAVVFQSTPILAVGVPIPSRPLPPANLAPNVGEVPVQNPLTELPLSPGDRIKLMIPGVGSEPFNNNYVVNFDGTLDIPLIEPISVAGLGAKEVEKRISAALVQKRLFRPELLRVNVQLVELAPIQVTVIGATFDPGRIVLNTNAAAATISGTSGNSQNSQAQQTVIFPGSYSLSRYLTTALKTAGGVRPNANLSQIQLVRNGKTRVIDFSGVLNDQQIEDVPLIAGDQIVIPDAGKFQSQLVRPSVITPSRIPLYVSNLTAPGGGSNSLQEVEYGTRLSQALIAAQCVGGNSANSKRRAVLVRSDTRTGEAVATQRSVEDLTKKSPSVGKEDVYLMPRDGIACYDSRTTNIGSVLNILSNFFTPIGVVRSLFR